jgi:hypothetical protein
MAKRRRSDLARARAEAATLLRLDPQHLSPTDTLKCDIVASLRLVIDSAQADVLDGSSADLGKLLVAVETLTKLLPAVGAEQVAVGASDARARVLALILNHKAAAEVDLSPPIKTSVEVPFRIVEDQPSPAWVVLVFRKGCCELAQSVAPYRV